MSLLDKMIEKIGIVDEEYDDDEVEEGQQPVKVPERAVEPREESSIPPEFLQHLQRKDVEMRQPEKKVRETLRPQEVSMSLRSPESVEKPSKKGGLLGLGKRQEEEDLDPLNALAKAMHVVIVSPQDFNDSQKIADFIRRDQSVVINFERTDPVVIKRITDFICGVVYAVGGSVQKIGRNNFFCAPKSVDVKMKQSLADEDEIGR